MNTTGIIMASGEGSRLRPITQKFGLPKHLLPLGNTSSVALIIPELRKCCNQIILVCGKDEKNIFEEKISLIAPDVEIIPKDHTGFAGDYLIAHQYSKNEHIVLTVGDIVFKKHELPRIIHKVQMNFPKFTLVFDRRQIISKLDFRMVAASTNKEMLQMIMQINPESFKEVSYNFIRLFLQNKVRASLADVLFNLNTPESYDLARKYFES
ncbi:MAG: hypothetical protein A2381_13180 [Bdellovibrionales bacterium RIFOXYB1_FULL_37_110]|nr:MAG: hypothetical protein A2181_02505 [Bdellovibrionales bacterium RIFOXYA1_FULL_38_20]OFZ51655.1 MAG: hypothetical protein A2417_12840 [Bdellovibrionales bacterium RIFOXYC1_FULL_37_79]OFZ60482.1 MAG: hypothetical protein A2381_13180 [Bdellovibrionales bacterium RIFOXYB1_FULL_37_110]OFZ65056.1 MAG: hypothetical protein A2577_09445 [Bdellovibrionales bacterium RIFOXYD1_FULL_36_51]